MLEGPFEETREVGGKYRPHGKILCMWLPVVRGEEKKICHLLAGSLNISGHVMIFDSDDFKFGFSCIYKSIQQGRTCWALC
jgi:hypothetical protein